MLQAFGQDLARCSPVFGMQGAQVGPRKDNTVPVNYEITSTHWKDREDPPASYFAAAFAAAGLEAAFTALVLDFSLTRFL